MMLTRPSRHLELCLVFGNDRPRRIEAAIYVAAYDDTRLTCARCGDEVLQRDVALYSRTMAGHPFDPWCAPCALVLVRWAGQGAIASGALDSKLAEDEVIAIFSDGD